MPSRWEITDEQREQINTTGKLTLTPEQRELSFAESFVDMAFDYGLQYYGAARFAFASAFTQVAPTLLHHAVEMFLQACLAIQDTPAQIHQYRQTYFSHKLPKLWADLKPRYPAGGLHEFDEAIADLERFREIRFPENIAEHGASMQVGLGEPGHASGSSHDPAREFNLGTPRIDKLVVKLFGIADRNPRFHDWRLKNHHAAPYYLLANETPLIPPETHAA
jgi:hypothetical protein